MRNTLGSRLTPTKENSYYQLLGIRERNKFYREANILTYDANKKLELIDFIIFKNVPINYLDNDDGWDEF